MLACCSCMTNNGDLSAASSGTGIPSDRRSGMWSVIPETLFVPVRLASINPGEAVYVLPCSREQPGGW